jgi:hypothetical protein
MKKHTLKPGKHQFAPRSHPVHDNDSLSDDDVEWYLSKYPHIAVLFEKSEEIEKAERPDEDNRLKEAEIPNNQPVEQEITGVITENNEDLFAAN